jgi:Ca-activated chloride channel homolog
VTALLSSLILSAAAQAPLVFPTDVALVRVEVLVTRGGTPVAGLTAADFELRDDGRVQELEPVLEEVTPIDALLVLDASYSMAGAKLRAVQEAASAFLDGLREGERAAVMACQQEVQLLEPLTADLSRARLALSRAQAQGSTALVDAVYAALRATDPGPRRTAIVVFSDGLDNLSWLRAEEGVEAARRTGALVYGVAVRAKNDRPHPFLRDVTRATGGRLFEVAKTDELRAGFLDVLADIRNRYVLRYAPRGGDAPGWHTLEVKLKKGGGEVLARPGYWRAP